MMECKHEVHNWHGVEDRMKPNRANGELYEKDLQKLEKIMQIPIETTRTKGVKGAINNLSVLLKVSPTRSLDIPKYDGLEKENILRHVLDLYHCNLSF